MPTKINEDTMSKISFNHKLNEPVCFGRYKDTSEICDACMISHDCYNVLMKEKM
jgi:hypothetical protein